ncbi:3001_t:CDS:2 [Entrophospora sp. SA101]|nr:3001_t:CDS:2 [Entrophospora sp. SA101]
MILPVKTTEESMQRPDFLCTVDEVPFLSEIKPLGTSPLLKKKDFKKSIKSQDALNQQLDYTCNPKYFDLLLINAG